MPAHRSLTLSLLPSFLLLLILAINSSAQTDNSPVSTRFTNPAGKACAAGTGALYATTGALYTCQSGVFATRLLDGNLFGTGCADGTVPTYNASGAVYSCAATSNTANVVTGATGLATATWIPYVTGPGTLGTATTHGGPRYLDNATSPNWLNGWQGNIISASNGGYISATISGGGANTYENKLLCTVTSATHCAYSTIGGGYDNQMDTPYPSTIGGGAHNRVNMATSTGFTYPVAWTPLNTIGHGTIAGGSYNALYGGNYFTIGGGSENSIGGAATSDNSTIGGGLANKINGASDTISGGNANIIGNTAYPSFSTIGGGNANLIPIGNYATIVGGVQNSASSDYSTILGGLSNTINASTRFSLVGGRSSSATGDYSVAIGYQAIANAVGAWALADSTNAIFTNSTANSFAARFSGGYNLTGGATKVVGLTEASTASKPTCAVAIRGQFYVEKGTTGVADQPFVCVKNSSDAYVWVQLVTVP